MRVLILSAEVWRDDRNGGNVLSNIFEGLDAEFAQVYCNPGEPNNFLCKRYYQMTDAMVVRNILKRKKMGKILTYDDFPAQKKEDEIAEKENKKIYNFFRKFSFEIFHIAKEIAWSWSKWKNDDLEKFILDFQPDIVFAPCYASHFMLHLTRYVADLVKKPVISYVSDDNYTLNQFRLSPFYWLNRFILRKHMRKTYPYYSLVYTMTDEQKEIYEKALKCKMSILKKSGDFQLENVRQEITFPIRIIYAGGVYCGRDNTLVQLVKAIREINAGGKKVVLDIYTGNTISKCKQKILNDGENSIVHGLISKKELIEQYKQADIALHVESFKLKYKKLTKLSFSTKIMDCLESGAATLAIADEKQAGLAYLKRNHIAFTVTNLKELKSWLKRLVENPQIICEYSQKAYDFCVKEHSKEKVKQQIEQDFKSYVESK